MQIKPFHDPSTYTLTYVVYDEHSRDAVVIDPVLDYDPSGSATSTRSLDAVASFIVEEGLVVHDVLETHAHADHLSGSQYLKARFGARIVIGARISEVQAVFATVFDLGASFAVDGSQFDVLLADGETLHAGTLAIEAISTPGHTPACMTYKIADAVFTGDALFIEDYGTGRCDFPGGSADALYSSVHERLYALPDDTRVFVGHDYQPGGRRVRWETTIGASKEANLQLRAATSREDFVRARQERDAKLAAPRLLYPSVQVNLDAGRLPPPHANGRRYLTVPLRETPNVPCTVRDIDPAELVRLGKSVRVIDVREPAEAAGELGRIPAAELVPLATVESAAESWKKDEPLVLVCRSGARSSRAASHLAALGFRHVMNLRGGMLAWNDTKAASAALA